MLYKHMGVGSGAIAPPLWIFMHGTYKVEGVLVLMVLFFGLAFFRWSPPVIFSADALV